MSVRWLHISDFHFKGGDPYDRDIVLGALVRSAKRYRDRDGRPDLIFATGDVAHSGKPGEYEAATGFFDALLAATEVEKSRLFVIPGNHDIDRDLSVGLARTLTTREEADAYFKPGRPKPHITLKLGAFVSWYDRYFAGLRKFPVDSTCEIVDFDPLKIAVLLINSALFCQDDFDHAKLWVGRGCLDPAVETLQRAKADLKIALMHHPLDWLSDTEGANIRSTLRSAVDVILRGHLHETDVDDVAGLGGHTLHVAAGAAYQTRRWPNRALYCSFDGKNVEVFPIRYEDNPKPVWTTDPSLFPDERTHSQRYQIARLAVSRPAVSTREDASLRLGVAPLKVFVSYSHDDERMRRRLGAHLAALEDRGLIRIWHDREIGAGGDWEGEINREIQEADVVLLLITASFLNSKYCRQELRRALEFREQGKSLVVPITLRPCEWEDVFNLPGYKTQALPRDNRPIASGSWPSHDAAYNSVARELRKMFEKILGTGASV